MRRAMPIAAAPAIETAASAISVVSGIRVCSGRPFSSSSACAPTPIARKKASERRDEARAVELRRRAPAPIAT